MMKKYLEKNKQSVINRYANGENITSIHKDTGIVMESFFKSMKSERLYRTEFHSERELREYINHYIEFYNNRRPHSILSNRTPDAYEANYYRNHKDL